MQHSVQHHVARKVRRWYGERLFRKLLNRFGRDPSRWGRINEKFIARFQEKLDYRGSFSLTSEVRAMHTLIGKYLQALSTFASALQAHRFTDVPDLVRRAR